MATPVLKAHIRPHRLAWAAAPAREGALTEADFAGCRWIEGDPSPLRRGMFCGSPVMPGESWCVGHRSIVFGEGLAADSRPDGVTGGSAAGWQDRSGAGLGQSPGRAER